MSNNLKQTVNRTIAQTHGEPLLGRIVYWSISTNKKPVTLSQVRNALTVAGFDEKNASEINSKSAVLRAAKSFSQGSQERKGSTFHKKVLDDKDITAIAVIDSSVDIAKQDINFTPKLKIRIDKESNTLFYDGASEDIDKMKALIEQYKMEYSSDQIRTVVLRILRNECECIAVRDNGGVYFVPEERYDQLEKLQTFFKILAESTDMSLDTIPIVNREESTRAMWKAFTTDIMGEMSALKKELDDMDEKTRNSAKERKIDQFRKLAEKAEMYEAQLGHSAEVLKENIKTLQNSVYAMLSR